MSDQKQAVVKPAAAKSNQIPFERDVLEKAAEVARANWRFDVHSELRQRMNHPEAVLGPEALALAFNMAQHKSVAGWEFEHAIKPTATSEELEPEVQLALKLSMTSDQKTEQLKVKARAKIRDKSGVSLLYCKTHERYFEPPDTCGPCTKAALLKFATKVSTNNKVG